MTHLASYAMATTFSVLALIAQTAAQPAPLPPNTIDCSAFKKLPNGSWYVGAPTTFDIGSVKRMTLSNSTLNLNSMNLGGANLYGVLERKCGG